MVHDNNGVLEVTYINQYAVGTLGPDYSAFSDPDGDELRFTAESDDPSVSVTAFDTNLDARFPKQTVGNTITITVTAHDDKGGTVSSKWLIICR